MKQRVFTWTESAMQRFVDLSKPAQQVYLELLCLRDYSTGSIRVSQEKLKQRCNYANRQYVSRAIKELEDVGFIYIYFNEVSPQMFAQMKQGKVGVGPFNVYRLKTIKNGVIN